MVYWIEVEQPKVFCAADLLTKCFLEQPQDPSYTSGNCVEFMFEIKYKIRDMITVSLSYVAEVS